MKHLNFLDYFSEGVSPKKLLRHPVFWTVDRCKCFLTDLAGSRVDLKKGPTHRLLESWVLLEAYVTPKLCNNFFI